ncbi:unnamed protein product [Vitrella brassicaformis CCMP3155]|uniref:Cyclin C-terminal domain-containing protein n=1 Tax=Vitrella brassicaformis (strain CCMP3155) TaxID=1169540 RepID=A0A0G4FBM4_VITBC|nr:unnamed protein product [Vitrella brassicaformis CCMP3155]|eukprot:CEM10013.1 unnamed protein product [Vitrella brassicaformis CCMP3155]
MAAVITVGNMTWPQQRAVLVDGMVKRAASMGCRDATVLRAVRLLDVCLADKLIDTNDASQVAVVCVAACVKRLEPHLLMDDMPDDPTHTQVVGRAVDSSVCGIGCVEKLFTAAAMDTHGRLFSFAKYLMFLSMCDVDLAGCDVRLLAATAVYITRKTNQKQIAGGIWSAALVSESSVSESALQSSVTTLRMQRLMWGDTQTTKGIVTDAVDELFASPDRHGVASSRSHPQQEQQPRCQGGSQEHPVSHLFVGSRGHLPDIVTAARHRATSRRIQAAFTIAELRNRLANSLSRDGHGINTPQLQLVRFDPSLGMGDLMAAVWIAEEGGRWDETGEVLQLASQCRYCELPLNLTADDINTHANKTAYGSFPRVLAQLMVVGRHVDFGDGSRLQIFRHANGEVRAIKDEPGFRLDVDPPLAAGHLEWESGHLPTTDASLSSFAKHKILSYFYQTHQINRTSISLNRYVGGGRLDGLLTQSPHTPVAGCTTIFIRDGEVRLLVLTNSSHNFVAWTLIQDLGNNYVDVRVATTEAPVVGAGGPFKHRFPVTTQLARVALGSGVAQYVFDGQVDDDSDDDDSDDVMVTIWLTAAEARTPQLRRRTALTTLHRSDDQPTKQYRRLSVAGLLTTDSVASCCRWPTDAGWLWAVGCHVFKSPAHITWMGPSVRRRCLRCRLQSCVWM